MLWIWDVVVQYKSYIIVSVMFFLIGSVYTFNKLLTRAHNYEAMKDRLKNEDEK